MQITVNVQLAKGENLNDMSQDEAASAVINALGGDEDIDYCQVIVMYPQPGVAGTPLEPNGGTP